MVSGFLMSIIQDRYRYLHLSKTPKIAITGDFTWLVSIISILIFGFFLFPDHLESVFILQLFVGPILGLIPLIWKSNKNHFNSRDSHGIKPLNVSYLNFLRFQFYIGSIVSFAVSTNIVRYLSVEDLKTFKIIQTFLSPYQSLGSVLYVAIYANKKEKLADFTYRNMIRLSKKLLLVQLFIATSFFLLYAIFLYQFPNHYWFFPDLQSLIVSLIGPIIMVGFIPIGAYLRRNCMGRQILLAGLSGSLSYLILLFPLHLSRTILGIFFSTSSSIAITIILNVHFAKKYAQQTQRNI